MEPIIWVDGACEPNPGEMGVGAVIQHAEGTEELSVYLGSGTNNEAEYGAFLLALRWCAEHGVQQGEIRTDSQLLANQVNGSWGCHNERLQPLWEEARQLKKAGKWRVVHIRREFNEHADALSKKALTDRGIVPRY